MEKNDFMKKILDNDCGKKDEYSAEFSADEAVCDELELSESEHQAYASNLPADETQNKENGDIIYRQTCNYTMVNPEIANQENPCVIDYSGS